MKIACIYHSVDLDGWMSAAIVKHWFTTNVTNKMTENNIWDSIELIGYNYGQSIPDLSEYDKVIMCDISFPHNQMIELGIRLGMNFIYIDHHISAILPIFQEVINNNNFAISGIRSADYAACELTWRNFFNDKPIPEIVRLLGRYDCFGHKGTDEEQKVLEFQYGARMVISNYEEAYNYLQASIYSDYNVEETVHNKGIAIYSYLCTEAKQSYANGFEIMLLESKDDATVGEQIKRFLAINKERFNPVNFGIDYHADGYDGIASFHYDKSLWKFSLYNDNGLVDCSVIAKSFGGGGHKGAAGFILTRLSKIMPNMI